MWNFGNWNLGNFGNWNLGNFGNWNLGNFGNWNLGNFGNQNGAPDVKPNCESTAEKQIDNINKIIDLAKSLMPNYDYLSMRLSSALSTGKADCIAYSLFMYIACEIVGIKCDLIFCTRDVNSLFDGYHVFNRITLSNGDVYWSDTTYVSWGDDSYRLSKIPKDGQKDQAAYYLIGVDGSTCELDGLNLDLRAKTFSTFCMAANMIVAWTERDEYTKSKTEVETALRNNKIL